jgi:hypothetical protein
MGGALPKVEVTRTAAPTAEEDYDIDRIRVAPADHRPAQDKGIHATTLAFALVAMAILVAIALLWSARAVAGFGPCRASPRWRWTPCWCAQLARCRLRHSVRMFRPLSPSPSLECCGAS